MSSRRIARTLPVLYLCLFIASCRSDVEGLGPPSGLAPQRSGSGGASSAGAAPGSSNPIDEGPTPVPVKTDAATGPSADAAAPSSPPAPVADAALPPAPVADAALPPAPDASATAPDTMPSVPQTCSAGEVLCLGTIPQTCGADGKWVTGPPCPFACRGGCVNKFTAASAGRGAPTNGEGVAEFTRNGTTFYSERGGLFGARGFNVAVLDPATGAMLEPVKTFDPWTSPLSGNAFKDLAAYLEAIEPGRLVLIATCDDAGLAEANSCDKVKGGQAKKAVAAIERLGSKEIGNYCYRGAWSFIALTGRGALAEKLSTGAKITAEAFLPAAP